MSGSPRAAGRRDAAGLLRLVWRSVAAVALLATVGPLQALRQWWRPHAPPGPLPRVVHACLLRLFGLHVDVVGKPATAGTVVWTANHLSYLDIPVLGSLHAMRFVAKDEVGRWPVFGALANLQRTLYISRRPRDARRVASQFAQAVSEGGVLVLFPEGTSGPGRDVLPFRPSLLEVLMASPQQATRAQAVTLRLLEVDGRAADDDATRDLYAYHGDMVLLPHLGRFLRRRGARLQVVFHPPVPASSFAHRRDLAAHLHAQVVHGLRTGAPAT